MLSAAQDGGIGKEWGGTGNLSVQGSGRAGDCKSAARSSRGRMHITGPERCYLLHKDGVIIGNDWGGSGNLLVDGTITVQKSLILDSPDQIRGFDGPAHWIRTTDDDSNDSWVQGLPGPSPLQIHSMFPTNNPMLA
jgi:hypothetical protein